MGLYTPFVVLRRIARGLDRTSKRSLLRRQTEDSSRVYLVLACAGTGMTYGTLSHAFSAAIAADPPVALPDLPRYVGTRNPQCGAAWPQPAGLLRRARRSPARFSG